MLKLIYSRLFAFQELVVLVIFYIGWAANPFRPDLLITHSEVPYYLTSMGDSGLPQVQLLTINIQNRGASTIAAIELQVNGIKRVVQSGAYASFKRFDSKAAIVATLQPNGTSVHFDGIREIPPGHNIQLQVVAQTYQILLQSRVKVTSDAKEMRIYETAEISGILVFIERNADFLLTIILVAAALVGARRVLSKRAI